MGKTALFAAFAACLLALGVALVLQTPVPADELAEASANDACLRAAISRMLDSKAPVKRWDLLDMQSRCRDDADLVAQRRAAEKAAAGQREALAR